MATQWHLEPWAQQARNHQTARWKRLAYRVLRPVIDREARRHFSRAALDGWRPEFVLGPYGFPLEERCAWGARGTRVPDATLLVQGTGTGWDVLPWAALRPRRIIATDAFAFADSWTAIARLCRDQLGVSVEFCVAKLEDHSFLADRSIDLCVSNAVLEHCKDLAGVLVESRRLLTTDGHFYAGFGPLWYAPGGDHFCARAGLAASYAHIALDPAAYRTFFDQHRQPTEDFQSGGRYVELDLFSKLNAAQYLDAFRTTGFGVEALVAEVSREALAFKRTFPERFDELVTRVQGRATADDLLLKSLSVRLARA